MRLQTFEKTAAGLLSETEVLELEIELLAQPAAGDLIPGGRGLRKLRRPAKGRGKRGGARVIYYHLIADSVILLIFAYAKNEQDDLTRDQLHTLASLVQTELP